ncbi:MAG: mannose-6-phosphate isomerase, class I [Geodermatophilaceae bacterium]
MFALTNDVRRYAWGSRTAMAEFLGRPSPSAEPEAELWIGAYPACPSRVSDGRSLLQLIEADPAGMLGAAAVARFGPRLPFMMKVLAIGAPLSLQAHPDAAQAEEGFAAEEAAGVPLADPVRNYRDDRHKPEMLCALTTVEVFCGFRAVPETLALLGDLDVPELTGLQASLSGPGLRDSVRWVFELADSEVAGTVAALAKSANHVTSGPHVDALHWISRLADEYPEDRGVILSVLCDFVRLEPGQALVIPAGCLHGYLCGVGVETMTESDNVLRGGLTAKHVAVADLQRVLLLQEASPTVLRGETDGAGCTRFSSDVEEFELWRYEITDGIVLQGNRPRLILTVEGAARLRAADGTELDLPRGQAAFVAATEKDVEISGPAVVFEASTGQPAASAS